MRVQHVVEAVESCEQDVSLCESRIHKGLDDEANVTVDFGRAATESHQWTCQHWHKEGKHKLDREYVNGSCRTCYNKCPINTWKTGLGSSQ